MCLMYDDLNTDHRWWSKRNLLMRGDHQKNVDLCCLFNSKECCNNKTVCLDKDEQDNNKKRFKTELN